MRTGSVSGKRCEAIVYREYKECRVSACMNAKVRGIRIRCGGWCKGRRICLALLSIWRKRMSMFRARHKNKRSAYRSSENEVRVKRVDREDKNCTCVVCNWQ